MKSIVKKVAIFSMVGIMQIGLGASVIEASPLHNDSAPIYQRYDREHDRYERERIENERHEREMQRRHNESLREWHERQELEKLRHENTMNEIKAGLLGLVVGLIINNQ